MKLIYLSLLILVISCQSNNDLKPLKIDLSLSYKQIIKKAENIIINNNGKFPILVYKNSIGKKQLIYLGEQHGNDPNDNRFDTIQKYFFKLKPQVILNEGGQVANNIHYKNKFEAIKKNGTIGYLKFLADNKKIKLINADCSEIDEVRYLLSIYDRKKIIYFIVLQRFIPQYVSEYKKYSSNVKIAYKKFIENYLKNRCQLKLNNEECKWDYFKKLFKEYNKKEIDLNTFDFSQAERYLNEENEFGQISRSSIHLRDSLILTNIYRNLEKYDKVFIVFGGLHLIAEKPTLDKIFEK